MSQEQLLNLVETTKITAYFQAKEWAKLILQQGISQTMPLNVMSSNNKKKPAF